MKVICYSTVLNSCSVIVPVQRYVDSFESEDEALQAIIANDLPPEATAHAIIEDSELPQDRKLRNAWVFNGNAVVEDVSKARDLVAERINRLKKFKARELIEREMIGEDVTQEKAALRALNAADVVIDKTVEELKSDDVFDPPAVKRPRPRL